MVRLLIALIVFAGAWHLWSLVGVRGGIFCVNFMRIVPAFRVISSN